MDFSTLFVILRTAIAEEGGTNPFLLHYLRVFAHTHKRVLNLFFGQQDNINMVPTSPCFKEATITRGRGRERGPLRFLRKKKT